MIQETTMATIWFQLTTANGKRVPGTVEFVELAQNSTVANLRKQVKKEFGNRLRDYDPADLLVYASAEALEKDKDEPEPKHWLKAGKTLESVLEKAKDHSDENPLLIVVPDRVQATTSGTTVDEISDLTARLTSFANAQLVEGCIQSEDHNLLPYPRVPIKKLYVRECYPKVFDLLLESIGSDPRNFAISGTPGIGKSLFFIYILYRLMNGPLPINLGYKPKRIVYQMSSLNAPTTYFCFDLQQLRVYNIEQHDVKLLVWKPDTFYVADGPLGPAGSNCVTLHISSPRAAAIRDYVKQTGAKEWYLPIWTLDELQTCQRHCYPEVPIESVQENYCICGGVARFIFVTISVDDVKGKINTALNDSDAVGGVRFIGQTTSVFPVTHLLMHILVGKEEDGNAYKFADYQVASKYIGDQLWIYHSAQMLTNLRIMFGGSPNEISRHLFEIYGHRVFSVGGRTLKCRRLECGTESGPESEFLLDALQGERTTFGTLTIPTIDNLEGKYYEPTDDDNFPAIDSLSAQGMFQFTVAAEHAIRGVQILQKLCNLYGDSTPKLYFVVPPHRFAAFKKKQPFKAKKGNDDVNEIPGLEQYVLELPVQS